jgi:hypothetical protein
MTRFDITLKSIIRSVRTRFLQSLAIEGEYSEVSPNFPDTRERRVDFVARVKAGRKRAYLAHVELQAAPDRNIATRMLNYRVDIRTWQRAPENREFLGLDVRQTLVYLGPGSWKPKTEIDEQNLRFSYNFVDAKSIDPGPLLESENLGDVTLAVLCRDGKRPDVIRRVVTRIAAAPASEQPDALTKLSVLSDLRGIGPRVQSEVEKMGLPVNLEESTLLRGTFDRVRAETSIDDILEVLEARLPGALPADLKQRLADLGRDELKDVLRRSATAASVEEALAKPAGTTHGR